MRQYVIFSLSGGLPRRGDCVAMRGSVDRGHPPSAPKWVDNALGQRPCLLDPNTEDGGR